MKKMKLFIILFCVVVLFLGCIGILLYQASTAPDTQCLTKHQTSSLPPPETVSANDYFLLGDYDYDSGNCRKAIADYSQALALNPSMARAYNNRAYTYMRLQQYQLALLDLNLALQIQPDYIQAHMNRGDLYNYYGPVFDNQKAIADYQKVIALGGGEETSVCGHLFMAQTNHSLPQVLYMLMMDKKLCRY